MTATTTNANPATALPEITLNTVALIVLSGAVGTLAFDLWGKAIAPLLGLGGLAPVGLARGFLGALGLPNSAAWGNFMHLFLVGVIAYPVGWLFIARPIMARVVPGLHWSVAAALYGVALWVFAIGFIAWIAGNPAFLGFARITWVALAGHVIYAVAAAGTVHYLTRPRV
ncbi:hypothetical protein KUL25_06560 [Rhodobacteraceae bacterium N5(2021)]|uniref:Uncharacterized protein n=1 Tax=Gymnodinialimonas phycosphaerae TaxID=2841589 RepID=A0A975YH54_9RHOB|nr:hypothetical protein [Gymnodinialimonas phycosphaerae]MBY4892421.1 hypothetical protein [Gymnodinialimonas phycosphaerae]